MPSSRRAGQHEPLYATPTHPTTGSEVRMAHSGAWVGCEGPGESEAPVVGPAHREAPWIRTSEVRKQGQFVTVVEVEKDGEETADTTCHAWRATTQPVPRPAPRGFVTVVAVGTNTNTSLHLDHAGNLAVDSNVKLHMELPGATNADYVNQETIDRERKAAEEQERDADTPSSVPDQVVVYRLPGERLGLGLKFDGGMGAQECVRRLFIQSVAPDSPAARAAVPWGELHPGDQILNIEGCSVSSMTRVQCVSFLKDAAMKITIGVLKGNGQLPDLDTCTAKGQDYGKEEGDYVNNGSAHPPPLIVGEMRKRMPPPPLPPRAKPRKSPARPPKDPLPPPPSGFQDLEDESSGQKVAGRSRPEDKDHPEWRELLSRRGRSGDLEELLEDLEFHLPSSWAAKRLEDSNERGLPPRPSFYLDLVGEEDAAGPCESESDETSSSVSTVIDRLSLSSSTTVSRNSSFNASADASRFDLARALSPFEQLEKELETEVSQEAQPASPATAPREEVASAPPVDRSTKPAATTPAPDPAPAVEAEVTTASDKTVSKTKTRSSIKSFALSLKGRPFSWQQGKNNTERAERGGGSRGEGLVSIRRPGKRPAPPPPPRSVAGGADPASTPPCTTSASATAGVKETGATSDSTDTVARNDDSYIDIAAEVAKEADIHKSATLRRNRLERQPAIDLTTEEETEDFSISAPSERPKPEAEYLMLLDSPTGVDQVDALLVSAQDDKEENNEGDGKECEKDSLDRSESLVNSESKAEEAEDDVTSQSSEDHDASSVVEENSYTAVHEETQALTLSRSYVETQAEVHHQPREGRLRGLEVETEGQCGEVAQKDEGVKVDSLQDSDTEADGDDEGSGDEHRGGSESEVCDTILLGDAATSDDDDDGNKASSDAVCHKLGQETKLDDTAERKEVTNIDLKDGNVALVTEKEETANVKLHSEKIDNELNDSLVSEGTESDDVNDKGELKVEENSQVSDAEGGSETDVSMIEHSTRSDVSMIEHSTRSDVSMIEHSTRSDVSMIEHSTRSDVSMIEHSTRSDVSMIEHSTRSDVSMIEHSTRSEDSMKAEGEPDGEREEEHTDKEAPAEDGGGRDDSREAEGDQNLYEEIDDTTCCENQDQEDQEQEIFYSCSSPKQSAENSPRDLILNDSATGEEEEDRELYDDVLGPPSDQAWSESQDSSDLQGLKLSGPEEESGEQDTVDESFESLYDDVLEGDGSGVTEGVKGSTENTYENVEESELTEGKADDVVVNGDGVRESNGGSVIKGVKGSMETVYENVEESEMTEDTEVTLDEGVTSEASECVASGGESEAHHGSVKTVTECVRHRRLRQDIGDLIRREMNLEDDVTVEVEEEEEVESTVECENEEELLLVMRALRRDQPGDSLSSEGLPLQRPLLLVLLGLVVLPSLHCLRTFGPEFLNVIFNFFPSVYVF
ncbi:uncharacterized protein LOC127007164 isoform X2 [Eriocheir sinensis]|uniref:uncharacterized protein LOC127007164 isoform X2 n=1 Tax=Eriocheir sinensis TaxID=95602 RepID=UPI0021CA8769|nr:uncharacterized protein LOC127007164 isoform X2 [Eriocheir sinensis]